MPRFQVEAQVARDAPFYDGVCSQLSGDRVTGPIEGATVAANGKYIAIPWEQNDGSGAIMVFEEEGVNEMAEDPRYRLLQGD